MPWHNYRADISSPLGHIRITFEVRKEYQSPGPIQGQRNQNFWDKVQALVFSVSSRCLSLLLWQNTMDWVALETTLIYFLNSGGWEVQYQGANRLKLWWGHTSWSPHSGRDRGPPWSLFYKGIDPSHEAAPSRLHLPLKTLPPRYHHIWDYSFNILIWGLHSKILSLVLGDSIVQPRDSLGGPMAKTSFFNAEGPG